MSSSAREVAAAEREFLPAALEIVETPPSPIGRAITWLIILFFVALVTWSCLAEVDVVAVAQGKIIPAGKEKIVQARAIGTVKAIHVRDGERVSAGQPLIELDPAADVADMAALAQRIDSLEETLPLVSERSLALRDLAAKGLVPRNDYLQTEERRLELTHELAARRHELEKLSEQAAWRIVRAPVNGVVQELAMHTVGGVVQPAQALMKIVPLGETLQVEAWLENKDIGFVEEGQPVSVKLETFPFTRYGTAAGRVSIITDTAVEHESLGLIFGILIDLEQFEIAVGPRWVPLQPGMVATAEIKIGRRIVIDYFLSPLLRYVEEGLAER